MITVVYHISLFEECLNYIQRQNEERNTLGVLALTDVISANTAAVTVLFNLLIISFPNLAADNGSLYFWDWKTGYNFQRLQAAVQPGSLDSEAGIFAMTFDQSSGRLITCEADKTIKIYKEDDTAVRSADALSGETTAGGFRNEYINR